MTHNAITYRKGEDTLNTREEITVTGVTITIQGADPKTKHQAEYKTKEFTIKIE